MILFQSILIAFSMYSAIPVPIFSWDERNMRYAMVFLPWVGVVCSGGMLAVCWLSQTLGLVPGLTAALLTALPVAVSGGIHFDGFCDTVDALSSHRSREEKLEILKDSHTGAFAILATVFFVLVEYGFWQQLTAGAWPVLAVACLSPVLMRCLSGVSVMVFPKARKDGLVATFAQMAAKKRTAILLGVQAGICGVVMAVICWYAALAAVGTGLLWFWRYFRLSRREFGGVTGDLAGFFLTVGEGLLPAAVCLAGMVAGGIG